MSLPSALQTQLNSTKSYNKKYKILLDHITSLYQNHAVLDISVANEDLDKRITDTTKYLEQLEDRKWNRLNGHGHMKGVYKSALEKRKSPGRIQIKNERTSVHKLELERTQADKDNFRASPILAIKPEPQKTSSDKDAARIKIEAKASMSLPDPRAPDRLLSSQEVKIEPTVHMKQQISELHSIQDRIKIKQEGRPVNGQIIQILSSQDTIDDLPRDSSPKKRNRTHEHSSVTRPTQDLFSSQSNEEPPTPPKRKPVLAEELQISDNLASDVLNEQLLSTPQKLRRGDRMLNTVYTSPPAVVRQKVLVDSDASNIEPDLLLPCTCGGLSQRLSQTQHDFALLEQGHSSPVLSRETEPNPNHRDINHPDYYDPTPPVNNICETVRIPGQRKMLVGVECACCSAWYKANAPEKLAAISRHRVITAKPKTPPRYWALDFPKTQEIEKLRNEQNKIKSCRS